MVAAWCLSTIAVLTYSCNRIVWRAYSVTGISSRPAELSPATPSTESMVASILQTEEKTAGLDWSLQPVTTDIEQSHSISRHRFLSVEAAQPSSILAVVTTAHLALAALRHHRSAGARTWGLSIVSLTLAAAPWLFPSVVGLALGLGGHLLWFVACELLTTPGSRAAFAPAPAASVSAPSHIEAPAATEAPLPGISAAAPRGFVQTPVIATVDETRDIKTIRLVRPEGFSFEAGQFVPLRVRVNGGEYVRCYSISSAPQSTGYLEISVKRLGLISNALHATARPGAILSIKAPNGKFRYPAGDDRPIVLLAGGVGITPLMSMVRHAVQVEPSRPVTLFYSAQDERSLAFRDDLAVLGRRHPQLRVIYTLTRQTAPGPAFYPGRIDAALLQAAIPDIAHALSFICGPQPMIAAMREHLMQLGVPLAQIRYEAFEAAVAVSTAASAGLAAVSADAAAGRARTAPRHVRLGASSDCQMRCLPAGVRVPVRNGQTLLEDAEASGVNVPSLCRAGVCGTCRIRVTEGEVDCESMTLDAAERGQGYVLACVSQARTDCTVQL